MGVYKQHQAVEKPDDSTRVLRYMLLTKLLQLLDTRKPHFSSISSFEDDYEMLIPEYAVEATDRDRRECSRKINHILAKMRHHIAASCWFVGERETEHMWRRYYCKEFGCAIRTTSGRLCGSFRSTPYEVDVGLVKYIDYKNMRSEKIVLPTSKEQRSLSFAELPLLKRKEYELEKELRAFIISYPPEKEGTTEKGEIKELDLDRGKIDEDIDVEVEVDIVIEELVINSSGARWFDPVFKHLIEKYNYNLEITVSPLFRRLYEHLMARFFVRFLFWSQ